MISKRLYVIVLSTLAACGVVEPRTAPADITLSFDRAALRRLQIECKRFEYDRRRTGMCALGPPGSLVEMQLPERRVSQPVATRVPSAYRRAGHEWLQAGDLDAVDADGSDDGSQLRVRVRDGDTAHFDRVVAWLERCGGVVARAIRDV